MSLQPQNRYPIPEETGRIARAAFPNELGEVYQDAIFAELFPEQGQNRREA